MTQPLRTEVLFVLPSFPQARQHRFDPLAVEPAAPRHHARDPLYSRHILARIRLEQEQVRPRADLHGSELLSFPDVLGRIPGCGCERLVG